MRVPSWFTTHTLISSITIFCKSQFWYLKSPRGVRQKRCFKKRLWLRCVPVNFAKFWRKAFPRELLWWPFLWYVLTSMKICWKWTSPVTFPCFLKKVAYLKTISTTDACILKPTTWLSMQKHCTSKQDIRQHDQDLFFCYGTRLLLKPGFRLWTWTPNILIPEKPGPKNPGPWKTC